MSLLMSFLDAAVRGGGSWLAFCLFQTCGCSGGTLVLSPSFLLPFSSSGFFSGFSMVTL